MSEYASTPSLRVLVPAMRFVEISMPVLMLTDDRHERSVPEFDLNPNECRVHYGASGHVTRYNNANDNSDSDGAAHEHDSIN